MGGLLSPRERSILLEKLASSLEKALEGALPDKVTRTGAVLSPYFTQRLRNLLGELNSAERKEEAVPGNPGA